MDLDEYVNFLQNSNEQQAYDQDDEREDDDCDTIPKDTAVDKSCSSRPPPLLDGK